MKITVNEGMVQLKMLRQRYLELRSMRDASLVREETRLYGLDRERDKTIVKEPQYDAVKLDVQIVELELAIHDIDAKIKASNALTQIDVTRDIKDLLSPIQAKAKAEA